MTDQPVNESAEALNTTRKVKRSWVRPAIVTLDANIATEAAGGFGADGGASSS